MTLIGNSRSNHKIIILAGVIFIYFTVVLIMPMLYVRL